MSRGLCSRGTPVVLRVEGASIVESLTHWLASPRLFGTGLALVAIGVAIWWRTSRYDLKGVAIDSAWHLARGKRTAESPTEIETRLRDIAAAPTVAGKAGRAAGTVIGHFVAQVLSVVALVLVLGGGVLAAIGIWWR